jgi:hypothetical protein
MCNALILWNIYVLGFKIGNLENTSVKVYSTIHYKNDPGRSFKVINVTLNMGAIKFKLVKVSHFTFQ